MPLQAIVYCSIAELDLFMSSNATTDYADHDADGTADTDVIEDCINQGTDEIDLYAGQQHTQAQLATSTLINKWCIVMSARFLQERRMNVVSESIVVQWDRIIENLQKVAENRLQLPGLAKRDDMRPTWSNLKIDRRFRHSKIRVTRTNSSSAPTKLSQDATLPRAAGRFD